jgi:hypothetical protein
MPLANGWSHHAGERQRVGKASSATARNGGPSRARPVSVAAPWWPGEPGCGQHAGAASRRRSTLPGVLQRQRRDVRAGEGAPELADGVSEEVECRDGPGAGQRCPRPQVPPWLPCRGWTCIYANTVVIEPGTQGPGSFPVHRVGNRRPSDSADGEPSTRWMRPVVGVGHPSPRTSFPASPATARRSPRPSWPGAPAVLVRNLGPLRQRRCDVESRVGAVSQVDAGVCGGPDTG